VPLRRVNTTPQSGSGTRTRGSGFAAWGQIGGLLSRKALLLRDFQGFQTGISRKFRLYSRPEQKTKKERNMKIREGMEQRYAEFIASQNATAEGQALVQFMETWSGMMECAVEHGADNVTEAAGLTVQAAADAAGVSKDEVVVTGAAKMLDCWAYGDGLKEWFMYRPPEILNGNPNIAQDLWYASQGLCDAIPKIVDAYPCILDTAPGLLEVRQMVMNGQQENTFPIMSM